MSDDMKMIMARLKGKTINEIKRFLVEELDMVDQVYELLQQKPKKQDWLKLAEKGIMQEKTKTVEPVRASHNNNANNAKNANAGSIPQDKVEALKKWVMSEACVRRGVFELLIQMNAPPSTTEEWMKLAQKIKKMPRFDDN